MRTRSLLLAPALLAGALLSSASSAPEPEAPPVASTANPSNLEELGWSLDAIHARFGVLKALAERDPDHDTVAAYVAYMPEDFSRRKRITASDLLRIWADPQKEMALREKAHAAMMGPTPKGNDPELVLPPRGARKPRHRFAEREVVPLLEHADAQTREFAHTWLKRMCIGPTNEPAIDGFDARKSGPKEIRAAQDAWRKFLRR
jgi:hypothetical protein